MTTLAHTGTITADATSAKMRKRTLVSLAIVALAVGVASVFAYSQLPAFANDLSQASDQRGELWDQLTAPASRKARCIMPPAWRRHCDA